jgi:DNA-binding transcriptional regulator YiaG
MNMLDAKAISEIRMNMLDAKAISEIRWKLRLTQAEFGALLDVTSSTVSLWEQGKRHPAWKQMVKLNELAKVPPPERPPVKPGANVTCTKSMLRKSDKKGKQDFQNSGRLVT